MIDRLSRQIAFFAPAAVMAAWGTVMLHTVVAGRLNELLSPMFRPWVLVASAVLLLLSAIYLCLYEPSANPAPPLAPTGRLRQLLRWTVMLLPVVAASVLSPNALSSTTSLNRGINSTFGVAAMPSMGAATSEDLKRAQGADPNQPVPVEVTDLVTLARSPALMKNFVGRKVRAIGFVVTEAGHAPRLMRWMMWCCAADAVPISVQLGGNVAGTFKDSQWYEVSGAAQFPSTLGQVIPEIKVDTIQPTTEPDEPYLDPLSQ